MQEGEQKQGFGERRDSRQRKEAAERQLGRGFIQSWESENCSLLCCVALRKALSLSELWLSCL